MHQSGGDITGIPTGFNEFDKLTAGLQPGDLLGSGTMSGAEQGSQGALIEITRGGSEPVDLASGEVRTFLEDGDTVILRAHCERSGAVRIGFGEAVGTVLPARLSDGVV